MKKKNDDQFFPPMLLSPETVNGQWSEESAIDERDLQDPRVKKILAILREVETPPPGKRKSKWLKMVAIKHNVPMRTIYDWLKKYKQKGIARLRHTKPNAGKSNAFDPEALEFFFSLYYKREHRHINNTDLFEILAIEAKRQNWKIGAYKTACALLNKNRNPLLEAMQRGGTRALDNILTPVLRDYSDLAPNEIIVGDQHRFDRWVVDEETGEVFRPEGYLWQDLRSRTIYGAAVDKKYDAWLIGLALRVGVACFGAFGSIYTDNGRPELSKFIMSVLSNMHALGLCWKKTDEVAVIDLPDDVDVEEINPYCVLPGTHRKAIVKNAKAKMIEGTFYRIEQIMASRQRLPGQTKKLSDDIHWQDVDHQEALKFAQQGKLLTKREFIIALFTAINYYNTEKPHRGVLREWSWKNKPKTATPFDCLRACYDEGWRPRMISKEAADLVFLDRGVRVVQKGMISLANEYFCHDALLPLHKQRVEIRFNPMVLDEVLIFQKGKFICTARPLERSSMIDADLASRKIAEKRERRKKFAEEFRRISSIAPDFRQYSTVPEAERVAALVGAEKKRRLLENKEYNRPVSQAEIDEHIFKMEAGQALPAKHSKPLPERPDFFLDRSARFLWLLDFIKAGGELTVEDAAFKDEYLAEITTGQRDYFEFVLNEYLGKVNEA